ncbi:MGT1 [Candida margitis]|uniref:MGT1 n=1 Tax=Candida margitis TaxID=1775924 RepID=UPI002226DDB1|nr:MGT1 [Candida margitis]KAI5959198.1 MGT1 [Candida margitis]
MKTNNRQMKNLYYTAVYATPVNALLVLDTEGRLYYASLGQNITDLQNLLVKDFRSQSHVQLKPLSTLTDKIKAENTIAKFKQLIEDPKEPQDIPIEILFGTRLQRRVWQELIDIPVGQVKTYGQIAERLDLSEKFARAVGAGCGANRIAIVIPCHRVVGADRKLTGYRYGTETKAYLLKHELGNKFSEMVLQGVGKN